MRRLSLAVLALAACAQVALAGTYFPNRTTDSFTYQNLRFGGESTATVDTTSGSWKHWTNFAGLGPQWVWTSSTSEVVYLWANGRSVLFADLSAAVGTRWDFGGNMGIHRSATLVRRAFVTVTPGGTFRNCVMVDLESTAVDAGIGGITFAPGTGVVQWFSQSIAGPQRSVFVRGTVGGLSYPRPAVAGLRAEGWTDQYEYFIDATQGQSSGPTKLNASITVRNSTARTIPMWFMSGQSFDLAVYDVNTDEMITIWSANKRFTNQMRQLSVAPGGSMTFSGNVDLVGRDGALLPSGTYRVRIWLTAVQRVAAEFTIQVNQAD